MPRSKVFLSNLLSFRVKLDSSVETTEFFVLLTYTELSHYHNCNEVVELILQGLSLRIRPIRLLLTLFLDLPSQAVAPLFGEPESLTCVLERLFVLVQKRIAIGQIEVGFSEWE